ncbi:unnamed protein product [Acanthoscelides obtectus]|uniref:Small ribosomal subunit protein mS39 n=1 Tax=Acanthoscelides obtectus TaxID=200917 RepID=A0A9P0L3H3_ACAOB|nr:unnamed protein product [Acanthoscelides obtectus]CAK1659928.1 Protein PTCD3 homolog, mitochondrial [Acanthoscelides obtectus]
MLNSQLFLKRYNSLHITPKINSFIQRLFSAEAEEKIEIPKRIHRGPTDILRALEATISRDPTAAHYKYHDDPYLIPMSNMGKRTFAMAQESGRKAAHWIRKEHADLFNHREADPVIKAFLPVVSFNEQSDITEDNLKQVIDDVLVSEAQLAYKLLKDKGVDISEETRQALLELLCYTNDTDILSEEFIEERWFRQTTKSKEKQRKIWKDNSLAEEIFISIENPTAETYSAMIQGMCKYFQVDKAWHLYEESQEKGLILTSDAYSSLLRVVNFLKESFEMKWALTEELLQKMNEAKVKPNLTTLNSALHSVSTMGGGKNQKDLALKVLKEFKGLGIEPSLGSWYYILITFCKERGPISTVLHDIMPEIENKEHHCLDLSDTYFFVTAMDICRSQLNDVELGRRVHKLLHFGNNYNLIGDSYKESIYYRHYFGLMMNNMPFEEFMQNIYNMLVPNIYVPEPGVMAEVLKQVDLNGSVEYVAQLWSDMIIFDHINRENLIESILNILDSNKPEAESNLIEVFSCIAWDLFKRLEDEGDNRFNKLRLTGDQLGKVMILLLWNKDFQKACLIFDKLDQEQHTIVGVPKIEALSMFIDSCIENKMPSRAIACLQYCSDSGFPEVEELGVKIHKSLTLDENNLAKLTKIAGNLS